MTEVLCPHCPNMVNETDTVCSSCGNPINATAEEQEANPLIILASQFGIPPITVQEGQVGILHELVCTREGIRANYLVPSEVHVVK